MYNISVPVGFRHQFKREEAIEDLKRCSVKRVVIGAWRELNGEYGFFSQKTMVYLKENIEAFKENGFEVIVWLGETLGHDKSQVNENYVSPYDNQYLIGQGRITAFCPLGEAFRERFANWICHIASLQPDMILIDDDFRLNGGCLCPLHMKRICEELGEEIDADTLVKLAFCGGKNRYRDAYIHSQGDSMREFAKQMRQALNTISPSIRLGICATPFLWDSDGCDVVEIANLLAGDTKPFARLFGAPYHAAIDQRLRLGTVIEHVRSQAAWFFDTDAEVLAEGDTWPQMRHVVPAAYLETYDNVLRAAGETTGIFKMLFNSLVGRRYESKYVDWCAANMKLYKKLEQMFANKKAVGVRPYLVPHLLEHAEMEGIKSLGICTGEQILKCGGSNFNPSKGCGGNYNASIELAVKNSMATTYEKTDVNILFGEHARHISEEELICGAIIDLRAAKILTERGIDVGIAEFLQDDGYRASIFGFLGYDPVADFSFKIGGAVTPSALRLRDGADVVNFWIGPVADGTMGKREFVFRYENANGQRFFVFPFDAQDVAGIEPTTFGYLDGYRMRKLLWEAAEWIGRRPLDAYCVTDAPLLYFLVKKNESGLAVGLWNLFEDKVENPRVKVNAVTNQIRFVNCTGHLEGDVVVIDGTLYPYEFAGFEVLF